MFNAKQLTDEQVSTVTQWAADGAQLNDIQKKMESDMELKVTYMDVRFLVLDLGLTIRDLAQEEAEKKALEASEASDLTIDDIEIMPPPATEPLMQAASSVSVTVDTIAKPGLMASGRVTFPDGQAAAWYIDERGLGLDPDSDDFQPSQQDIEEFQKELQRLMESH